MRGEYPDGCQSFAPGATGMTKYKDIIAFKSDDYRTLTSRMLGPDRLCLVTDAIAAAGMEDGEYRLATRTVYVDGGVHIMA